MMNHKRCLPEEIQKAKEADLVQIAEELGYKTKRVGRFYTLAEIDSIRIYNRKTWFRWSRQFENGEKGGTQIDFVMLFAGMTFKEAVRWILDRDVCNEEKKEMLEKENKIDIKNLPKAARSNRHLYEYLVYRRKIRKEVVDLFVRQGLIYESLEYQNIVFLGIDKTGEVRTAFMRGTWDRPGKESFKCEVAGSSKKYGFHVVIGHSTELIVFEGAIDLMSYLDQFGSSSNMIALGMLGDGPVQTFLEEYPYVEKIVFCLDNDAPGRSASEKLMKKYGDAGYIVEDRPADSRYKDYNEWLSKTREGWKG